MTQTLEERIEWNLEELKREVFLYRKAGEDLTSGDLQKALATNYKQLAEAAQKLIDALEDEKRHKSLEEFCGQKINRVKPSFENLKAEDLMSKPEPQIDIKEERVEPVSIWKDVSELPKVPSDCFIKTKPSENLGVCFGVFQPSNTEMRMFYTKEERSISKAQTDKYCTLTDFINSFEQMQKDIEELNKKIKHLMTRKELALLEMIKRGGTINVESFLDWITQIKNNFPICYDSCSDIWRGAKGLVITNLELHDMSDFHRQVFLENIERSGM